MLELEVLPDESLKDFLVKSALILVQLSFHLSGRWFAIKRKDNPLSG